MQLNINDIMHRALFTEANMMAAVEASLYGLVSKTVCGGSGQICKWVLFKRRIKSHYYSSLA